jgi:hypothetical protein
MDETMRTQPWLVVEDLLLLLLDDQRGTLSVGVDPGLAMGGALLMDLARAGLVQLSPRAGLLSSPTVTVTPDAETSDPLLRAAAATVAAKPRNAMVMVRTLAKVDGESTRDLVAARLVERGVLERRGGRVLGLFPRTEWPTTDAAHEAALRAGLREVLILDRDPTSHQAAVISILQALNQLRVVAKDETRSLRDVTKRAKAIREANLASDAVEATLQAAVQAAEAATIAAVSAAVSAAVVATAGASAG